MAEDKNAGQKPALNNVAAMRSFRGFSGGLLAFLGLGRFLKPGCDKFLDIADFFLDILQRNADLGRLGGALLGQGLGLLVDPCLGGLAMDLFADPSPQEFDGVFTHTAVPWPQSRLVIINVDIPQRMHVPIPAESRSAGKPMPSKVHRAIGNRGVKSIF
ncbi:hypothetical protein [Mesorhizobium sp. CO1-1-8]|uniref:hypothetical protein n=1 Tax=Mesorhizobium sp. CO1-1-8 TaxID=2876631 RepID=UPI001CD0958B|nr:hypothetical protein [Mesorhizobium sp. CO1-1-8]MBZ9775584.1 hypothetical protein [Mesorhizobium sp. CO1-1-8]